MARSHLAFLGAWSKPPPGVIFTQLRGYSHVIMEVDCLELVNLWNSRRISRSIAAPILNKVEDIVPSFTSFLVRHIGREQNFSAHLCAQRACTLEGTGSWIDQSPDFLLSSLRADTNRTIIS